MKRTAQKKSQTTGTKVSDFSSIKKIGPNYNPIFFNIYIFSAIFTADSTSHKIHLSTLISCGSPCPGSGLKILT